MTKLKEFILNNLNMVSKILANHFGMMIFGLVVLLTTKLMNNNVLFHCAGVLAILMYMFLLYMVMWQKGAEDKIKADAGRIEKNKLYGLYISLLAYSIFIIVAIAIFILSLFVTDGVESGASNACGILMMIMNITNGMYLSITSLFNNFQLIYLIIFIPNIAVCTFSYIAGLSGMRCIFPDKKKKK